MRHTFANGVTITAQTVGGFSRPAFVRGWWGLTFEVGPLLFGINRFGLDESTPWDVVE